MHRTTIALNDQLSRKLNYLAKNENRSTPNLIETILIRYLENEFYVDDYEMDAIRKDRDLQRSIKQGLADYKNGKGKFV